jgi:hypothetical protein
MSDGIRYVAHAVHQQLDLFEHAVDGARQRVEFVVIELSRQPVLQIAVHDCRYGLTDAMDPRHQRAAGDEADQQAGDGQDGDRAGEAVPEVGLQGCKQRIVPAHQQIVAAAQQADVHQHRLDALIAHIELDRIIAGCRRHGGGPRP